MENQPVETVANILTAIKAPATKETVPCIETWAKWLNVQHFDDPQLIDMIQLCAYFTRHVQANAKAKEAGRPLPCTPHWLTLIGKCGTGKSHCALKLWDVLRHKFNWFKTHYLAEFVFWPAFVSDLRAGASYNRLTDMRT